VEFLDETLKFYQDPQLNIDAQQSRICKSLRTTWGIPETVQQSRSSPRPTQPTTPIPDLISTFPAAHLRPDASRREVLALGSVHVPGSACGASAARCVASGRGRMHSSPSERRTERWEGSTAVGCRESGGHAFIQGMDE
jgi:hypothetical protein